MEGSPAASLSSPIFTWKKEGEGKGEKGRPPGCPRDSLEAPKQLEEESGGLPASLGHLAGRGGPGAI